jgi:hypothetical protein
MGLFVTVNLALETGTKPTLVTVPPPLPPPPPVELIVIFPVLPDKTMPVPADNDVTPVLVIVTVFVFASAFVLIPTPPAKVLYGLAHANRLEKLFAVFLNAVYSESLPADSLGSPTFMTCIPEIAMI